ncbi:MAG: hypothetical protein JWN14_1408, partial [Chthonomonadales bacterium]|nr:hypothetical protein [Chthonomonadales bacterium]
DGSVWGSSLDTQSIDFESIAPLLEGNLRLYEKTGESRYLTQAEDAAYYDAAWQMAQSIPNPPGSLMESIGYETFGVHSVATIHMCAHAFGLADFRSLWKLAQLTHKPIWRERAIATWNNATLGISDGTFAPMGEPSRPYGSQDETYDYTDWGIDYPWAYHLDRAHPRGSGSEWLVAWPTAMRLTILADPELRSAIEALPGKPLRFRPSPP